MINSPKKSLGQNFLVDKNIITKILKLSEIKNNNIVEIGPGKGALTDEILCKKPKSLILIEKDYKIAKYLKNKYANIRQLKIYNDDILKFDLEKILKTNSIIFGNLPYNISSQILVKMIKFKKWPPKFKGLVFMFQKELGNKIIAKYNSSGYGRLSILTQLRLCVEKKFLVSANCFWPKPKVQSMVIKFKPRFGNYKIESISKLEEITNIFFSQKRKMIKKNINKILNKNQIKLIKKINLNSRPSDVEPEVYYKITELIEKD